MNKYFFVASMCVVVGIGMLIVGNSFLSEAETVGTISAKISVFELSYRGIPFWMFLLFLFTFFIFFLIFGIKENLSRYQVVDNRSGQ